MIRCQKTHRVNCEQSNRWDQTPEREEDYEYTDQQEKQTKGKGGGRQGLIFIDGDVPLCMRSREATTDEPKKVKSSSKEANEGCGSREVECVVTELK